MSFIKNKRFLYTLLTLIVIGISGVFILDQYIKSTTRDLVYSSLDSIPSRYTVLVLGASVKPNGNLSTILKDRVESALQLYRNGKIERFLLSGDNGTSSYNEPKAMKAYLLERGVPENHIYQDYAGFDTYDSIYRAKAIFQVDQAIIVTQNFHLPRALYIAQSLDLTYIGYVGDKRTYAHIKSNKKRELLANVKAFLELKSGKKPTYLGDAIPINGKPQAAYK